MEQDPSILIDVDVDAQTFIDNLINELDGMDKFYTFEDLLNSVDETTKIIVDED
jgi:hypothetical protein